MGGEVKEGLLKLVDDAVAAGWAHTRACRLLGVADVRVHRWRARLREHGTVEDRAPGGNPVHRLLAWEEQAILDLIEQWGPTDRSHRKLAHRGSSTGVVFVSPSTVLRVSEKHQLSLPGEPPRPPRPAPALPAVPWERNRIWIWDASHFERARRVAYAIVDVVTRYWIGYLLTTEMTSTQVQVLFHAALEDQGLLDPITGQLLGPDGGPLHRPDDGPPILVAWSDNGPEMTSADTREFMALMAIAQHHGRPGTPTDQAHVVGPAGPLAALVRHPRPARARRRTGARAHRLQHCQVACRHRLCDAGRRAPRPRPRDPPGSHRRTQTSTTGTHRAQPQTPPREQPMSSVRTSGRSIKDSDTPQAARTASAVCRALTCSKMMNRELRSTTVPIADLLSAPVVRSPSHCPGHGPVTRRGRALVDHGHVHQPARAPGVRTSVRLAAASTGAQCRGQFASQPAQLRAVDRLVDRLGHQMPLRLVRELLAQLLADVLRAPPLAQLAHNELPQHRVVDQLPTAGTSSSVSGQPLRGDRPVPPAARVPVAAQLPADRRRATVQLGRDRAHRVRAGVDRRSGPDHPRTSTARRSAPCAC
jgi:putative transposase